MPSFNLPAFPQLSSPPASPPTSPRLGSSSHASSVKRACPPSPRPALSVIQPNIIRTATSSKIGDKSLSKPLPPPPTPSRSSPSVPRSDSQQNSPLPASRHSRSQSVPNHRSSTLVAAPRPDSPRPRKPLSRRYTRPASLSHLSSRSPLQSHSLPSFAYSTPASNSSDKNSPEKSNSHPETLFEELLTKNLEQKLYARIRVGRSAKGGERLGLGGLKPGREMLIWSAIVRANSSRSKSEPSTITPRWRESGLQGSDRDRKQVKQVTQKTVADEDDDDDDEPLGRKLQEAIEKRQKQLIAIQAQRCKQALETPKSPQVVDSVPRGLATETARIVNVRIKLPTCPKPAFLKPSLLPNPPPFDISSNSTLPVTPLVALEYDHNVGSDLRHSTTRSKRLRRNPTAPSLLVASSQHHRPLMAAATQTRSLSLPTVPPKIATFRYWIRDEEEQKR
ncbi:uncharacterized protein JCM15063_000940 [Sporobolomyces koalae]|uniref:uncharacterized protein n=1 Tax=Sporobolomyces koalae TaxID=500713 RepID=UPI0031811F06